LADAQRTFEADPFAKAAIGGVVFLTVLAIGYALGTHPPRDSYGDLIGRDFANTWIGARAALTGKVHALFDPESYVSLIHGVFGPVRGSHNWSYPPTILLLVWPLGFLPYFVAFALWSVVGLAAFAGAAGAADSKWKSLFLLAAPAVAINLFCGQNGAFTAALLILGFINFERRPLLAGLCFGVLTLKPQLALLIPLATILQRRWRCLAAGLTTAAILAALAGAIFGVSVWSEYFHQAVPIQQEIMNFGTGLLGQAMMPTAFMNARAVGLSYHMALAVQAPFTILAIGAAVWTYGARRNEELSSAVLLTACFVATPYMFGYDMVIFAWLLWRTRPHLQTAFDQRIALAVWTLPVATILLGLCHIPGSALVLPAFLLRLVWKLRKQEEIEFTPSAQMQLV
jgi:alpha-1,2-mannosyltransferase